MQGPHSVARAKGQQLKVVRDKSEAKVEGERLMKESEFCFSFL